MYRIMAQIMTKLPRDLRERVNGKQKLDIFQKISQSINIDNKLLEKFIDFDPTLNTPITMDLDAGDYNTLNKKYLNDLKIYEDSKGYINSETLEFSRLAQNSIDTTPTNTTKNLNAKYIDSTPDLLMGRNDNTLYYYDSSSGTLSEMPINNQTPVSLKDLKTVLIGQKINQNEIQGLIDNLNTTTLQPDKSLIAQPSNYYDIIGTYFASLLSTTATATTTTKPTNTIINVKPLPEPPKYMQNQVINYNKSLLSSGLPQINNLERKFKEREASYIPSVTQYSSSDKKSFLDRTNANDILPNKPRTESFTNMNEDIFLKKIKNDNKNIENVALGFVTIIILVFLLVIFNSLS